MNYGGLPEEFSKQDSSKIVILPVPYDGTSTWIKGADKGPAALIEASENMEIYDIETDSEVHTKGIFTAPFVKAERRPEKMVQKVYEQTKQYLKKNKFTVVIGGEHSVSIGTIKAHAEKYDELTIVQFDAHADMRDEYDGSQYNHACVMARVKEMGLPVMQIGIRSMSVEEREKIESDRVFYADRIIDNKSAFMYEMLNKLTPNVYITFDLDVFDPSVMPATGTPEPGGLGWYTILDILKSVFAKANVVGFDIVELCPVKYNKAPEFLAAKLTHQMLTFKFINHIE
ncbi:MAG: agmatinase [Lentimicrobiaceae bacterium]|nr:agmatinase [Lentimicrobiaceae bacterium]